MKYQLETIPIWEAYEAGGECPLCYLAGKLTKNYTSFFLGGSVMEPDIRGRVNELGFCAEHFMLLFEAGNKQAAALMAHTRLLTLNASLFEKMRRLFRAELATKGALFLPKKRGETKALDDFARMLDRAGGSCVFCEKLEHALARYAFTIVYLWKKDVEFRNAVKTSKGFCIKHLAPVIRIADSVLSRTHRNKFLEELFAVEKENLAALEEDILWYTRKFDHGNKDAPWKNSMYALQRTIQKLTGRIL